MQVQPMYDRETHAHSGPPALQALILPTCFCFQQPGRWIKWMITTKLFFFSMLGLAVVKTCASHRLDLETISWEINIWSRHLSFYRYSRRTTEWASESAMSCFCMLLCVNHQFVIHIPNASNSLDTSLGWGAWSWTWEVRTKILPYIGI